MLPVLETERLILRPFVPEDAPRVTDLAGVFVIADTTANIPHPYPPGAAEEWIAGLAPAAEAGTQYTFAITCRAQSVLIGAIGLVCNTQHNRAEMGYWIGEPYWRKGYATEAARRVVRFGFETLELNRIEATYFTRNPASARVMQKAGLRFEGMRRQAVRKWDRYEDLGLCGLVRADYDEAP